MSAKSGGVYLAGGRGGGEGGGNGEIGGARAKRKKGSGHAYGR